MKLTNWAKLLFSLNEISYQVFRGRPRYLELVYFIGKSFSHLFIYLDYASLYRSCFISLLFCFTRPKLNAPSDELVSIFLWNLVVQIRVYVSGICFMKV